MPHPSNFPQNFARRTLFIVGILVLLIIVAFVFARYASAPSPEKYPNVILGGDRKDFKGVDKEYPHTTIEIGGETVQVELVLTPAERAKGLSGRKSLAVDNGMLFVFETPGIYSFWMADMFFPIDIIWIDEQKKIVHIENNVLPESFPTTYTSSEPAKYVLEVPAGFSDKAGLLVGNPVLF